MIASQNHLEKNRGFSLIELLIAIAILAVAIVPIMHGFVSSIKLNSRMRGKLDATMVAEDLLEGVKNSGYSAMVKQYSNAASLDSDGNEKAPDWSGFSAFPDDIRDAETLVEKVSSDSNEILTIKVKDLKAGSIRYDALITVDPTRYKSDNGSNNARKVTKKTIEGGVEKAEKVDLDYNDQPLASLTDLGSAEDCIYNGDRISSDLYREGILLKARDRLKEMDASSLYAPGGNYDSLAFDDLEREFVIDVQRIEGKDIVKLSTNYYYPNYRDAVPGSDPAASDQENAATLFSRETSSNPLRNLFFLYYPGYDLHDMSDTIILNNGIDPDPFDEKEVNAIDFNFFIVKQLRADLPESYSYDMRYIKGSDAFKSGIHVIVHEPSGGPHVSLLSNLDVNASTGDPIITDAAEKQDVAKNRIEINGTDFEGDLFQMSAAGGSANRIYDVKVEVFEKGHWKDDPSPFSGIDNTKRLLASLESSMLKH